MLFALVTVLAGAMLAGTQSNAITSAVNEAWDVLVMTTTAVLLVVLGAILIGGVRRIARVAEWVVPLMAVAYLLVTALVMVLNAEKVPEVIMLVLRSAFGVDAAFGAMIGTAIQWACVAACCPTRPAWAVGAPAAAAEVSHPVKQGLVQSFSVYIDTMVVCSATAFLILSTGLYNVYDPAVNGIPDEARLLLGNLPASRPGHASCSMRWNRRCRASAVRSWRWRSCRSRSPPSSRCTTWPRPTSAICAAIGRRRG